MLLVALFGTVSDAGCRDPQAKMVETQIVARGVKDERVLQVMREVPRHLFVPPDQVSEAYADHPLSIGSGQTISQPYVVAFMSEQLRLTGTERVLEIGTGSDTRPPSCPASPGRSSPSRSGPSSRPRRRNA